jgi:hypothetical protein
VMRALTGSAEPGCRVAYGMRTANRHTKKTPSSASQVPMTQ